MSGNRRRSAAAVVGVALLSAFKGDGNLIISFAVDDGIGRARAMEV